MTRMLGYMLTWTTYGTWLQGDERGYVKQGRTHTGNVALRAANQQRQKYPTVHLSQAQRCLVHQAIELEAAVRRQSLLALTVQRDHIHLVAETNETAISKMVAYYKNAGRMALRQNGIVGKIWTKGYDKRFCFDSKSLQNRIDYVRRHNK